jgi:hypothetical protein
MVPWANTHSLDTPIFAEYNFSGQVPHPGERKLHADILNLQQFGQLALAAWLRRSENRKPFVAHRPQMKC